MEDSNWPLFLFAAICIVAIFFLLGIADKITLWWMKRRKKDDGD